MIVRENPLEDTLTWTQACLAVGVSSPTLRRMIRAGQLPAPVRVGRKKVFAKGPFYAALTRYLAGAAA